MTMETEFLANRFHEMCGMTAEECPCCQGIRTALQSDGRGPVTRADMMRRINLFLDLAPIPKEMQITKGVVEMVIDMLGRLKKNVE